MKLFQTLFNYVLCTTKQKHIDETHGLGHAINVLINSHQIFEHEKHNYPEIIPLEPVIYTSSILHDMCDKKYMDQKEGIKEINKLLHENQLNSMNKRDFGIEISGPNTLFSKSPCYIMKPRFGFSENDIINIEAIIETMSYSTVKKHGFPELGNYNMAYHIVREADLLAAYDFDRAIMYDLYQNNMRLEDAYKSSYELFQKRVFRHKSDQLLITDYSKQQHDLLCFNANIRINCWKRLLKI